VLSDEALSSLWFIGDAATSELVTGFNGGFTNPKAASGWLITSADVEML